MHPPNRPNVADEANRLILTGYRSQTINREIIGRNRASTFPHPLVKNRRSFLQRGGRKIQNRFPNLYLTNRETW